MPTRRINFDAATFAAALVIACSPTNSATRADGAATPAASRSAAPAPATDPIVAAADKGRIAGDSSAKTWVIIASDFQCPFCRQWHDESYRPLLDEYVRTGKVRVAYINYPLGQHENAVITAQGAMCAGAQKRFWEYHDALFDSQTRWAQMSEPRPVLDSIARAVGVDFPQWAKCVDSGVMIPLIRADRDRAAAAGVQSTPTFLIGDRQIPGAQPLDVLRPVIDSAIAKNRGRPPR